MEKPISTEDIFLDLMREETGSQSLSLEDAMEIPLAKTLLRTIRRNSEAEQASGGQTKMVASAATATTFSDPSVLFRTAIQDTFDVGELKVTDTERAALAAASDLVMIAGQRRLRLSDARRAEILESTIGTGPYTNILQQTVADDTKQQADIGQDPIRLPSAWLRCFLSGDFSDLDNAPLKELKAALEARRRLRLVKNLPAKVPPIDDIDRRVELAELLEPLRLLIGAEGGWDGSPRRDRFVGREDELKKLRAFVDELSSKSYLEAATRFLSNVTQTITGGEGPGIMAIAARGGLGKSTLLAKFVLDHALGQERPFPFAYLDFDRAGLDPGRPAQLLIEIARQVGLQFPKARGDLNRLADYIRAQFVGTTPAITDDILDPFARFVEIVRENATFGERAFLLVFDTMELVQWDSIAMDKLASLLNEFRLKGLNELKVVVSGRADVPELRGSRGVSIAKNNMELKPLQVQEARQLAGALGRTAIGEEWSSSWSDAISGKKKEEVRREPLAVRVAVDLITRARPEERSNLVKEISTSDLGTNEDFVARLYFKRVVNHVRDPLAQRLAWPGLVVRRVTVEIIKELLAPICDILPDQADYAFKALEQEVWIVTREGDGLKHRQDLRARTLPLMRNAEPRKFEEIARRAVDYFARHRARSAEDHAEWIYHRLLNGESVRQVAPDWQDDLLPLLARAAEDFPPRAPAASYLASRTAQSRLSPSRIRDLQANDALYHLSRTSAGTFALDDFSFDRVAQDVSKRTKLDAELDPSLNEWARALWIKTGAWQRIARQSIRRDASKHQLLRVHFFWAARVATTLSNQDRDRLVEECIELRSEYRETVGVRSAVQLMALARTAGSEAFLGLDQEIADMLSRTKPNPAPFTQAALRTAIVLGEVSRKPALELWLASRRRGSSDRVQSPSISLAEMKVLAKLSPTAEDYFYRLTKEFGESPARFTDSEPVGMADRMLDEMVHESDRPANERAQALSRLFACREEDWIVPLAYAAERAYGSRLSRTLSRHLDYCERGNLDKRSVDSRSDMVANMRNADEAGDLAGFTNLLVRECDPNLRESKDLRFLLDCRDAWRRAIGNVIGSDEMQVRDYTSVDIAEDGKASVSSRMSLPTERPPAPRPIINLDDPQKGRWGGQSARDGRSVRVVIDSVEGDIFYFSVIVESTDRTPLAAPVIFHLHDTFPRSVITIRRIENQQAILREWNAYGVFTIGVQVKNAAGQWMSLEIDLANAPGLPKRFLAR